MTRESPWWHAVECNRRGQLSDDQRAVIRAAADAIWVPFLAWISAVTLAGLPLLATAAAFLRDDGDDLSHFGAAALSVLGCGVTAWVARAALVRRRLEADLRDPVLVRVAGEMVFHDGWRRGLVLKSIDGWGLVRASFAPLGPGRHWCFVLPRSRLLVGAFAFGAPGQVWSIGELGTGDDAVGCILGLRRREAAGALRATPPSELPAQISVFANALGFSGADLLENRRGRMSREQRLRRLLPGATATVAAGVPVLVLGIGGWLESWAMLALGAVLVVSVLVFLAFTLDAVHGGVSSLDGVVTPVTETEIVDYGDPDKQIVSRHYLRVDGWMVEVDARAIRALSSVCGAGRRYRLYRAKWSGRLLSMEPLLEGNDVSVQQPWRVS